MTTEPIPDGYQLWGHGRSWIIELHAEGKRVWKSGWYTDKAQAEAAMRRLQGEKS